jgi:hypothetical protein
MVSLALVGLYPFIEPFTTNNFSAPKREMGEPWNAWHPSVDQIGNVSFGTLQNFCYVLQRKDCRGSRVAQDLNFFTPERDI